MNVLHVVHQYPPHHVGGTELYTQTVARYQVAEWGHRVAVFTPTPEPVSRPVVCTEEDGVRVYRVPAGERSAAQIVRSNFHNPHLVAEFDAVLQAEKPALVHIEHLMGIPLQLIARIRAAGIPYVVTLHDYWYPCANAQLQTNYDHTVCGGPRGWVNCGRCALARAGQPALLPLALPIAPLMAYRHRQLKAILAEAAAVVAPTAFVRDIYREQGMDAGNLRVISHGIEVPQWVLDTDKPLYEPAGGLRVAFIGSIARQKGVHVLIDAFNELPTDGAYSLAIYGGLTTFPDYVAELRRRATHPGIVFGGRLARTDVWRKLLTEIDVVVLPTLWYEASPLTIQEVFGTKTPLVGSRIGALPEKIRDGVDGVLFPAGDAHALAAVLRSLRNSPTQLNALRANIQPTRLVEDHLRDVEALYQSLVVSR